MCVWIDSGMKTEVREASIYARHSELNHSSALRRHLRLHYDNGHVVARDHHQNAPVALEALVEGWETVHMVDPEVVEAVQQRGALFGEEADPDEEQ